MIIFQIYDGESSISINFITHSFTWDILLTFINSNNLLKLLDSVDGTLRKNHEISGHIMYIQGLLN